MSYFSKCFLFLNLVSQCLFSFQYVTAGAPQPYRQVLLQQYTYSVTKVGTSYAHSWHHQWCRCRLQRWQPAQLFWGLAGVSAPRVDNYWEGSCCWTKTARFDNISFFFLSNLVFNFNSQCAVIIGSFSMCICYRSLLNLHLL